MTNMEKAPPADISKLLDDPAAAFAAPEDVLSHPGLSDEQKAEILLRWEYDAAEASVAEEEGMPDGDGELLRRIVLALDRLSGTVDLDRIGPTKQHGIPSDAVRPRRR